MSKVTITLLFVWAVLAIGRSAWADSSPTKIFRCEAQGRVTFADRPCSTQTDEVALNPSNSFSGAVSTTSSDLTSRAVPDKKSQVDDGASAAAQLKEKQRERDQCLQWSKQLSEVEAKLRSGYTAKQHNSLQERRRRLAEQLRQARCR